MTTLVEYYNRKNLDTARILNDTKGMQATWRDYFVELVDIAIGLNLIDLEDGGTYRVGSQKILNKFYEKYKKTLTATRYTTQIASKIESYIAAGKPVVVSLDAPNGDAHSVVICGYYDISIRYNDSIGTSHSVASYRYYVINDGWKNGYHTDNERIQYVNSKYVSDIIRIN